MIWSDRMTEVESYIGDFSIEVQEKLHEIRNIIFEEAPDATEKISFKMPSYKLDNKVLIYFAAFKKHIGLYALPEAIVFFEEKLVDYKTSKGTIQIPLNKPLPCDLIREIVQYRVKNL